MIEAAEKPAGSFQDYSSKKPREEFYIHAFHIATSIFCRFFIDLSSKPTIRMTYITKPLKWVLKDPLKINFAHLQWGFVPSIKRVKWQIVEVCGTVAISNNTLLPCEVWTPGGGGYLAKFNTGRLRPEVQHLTLLYTILAEKVPLLHTFYWKKVPLSHTYFMKSCSHFHV